jgi:uncharacterized protein YgbK (DUF1537 family)
MSKILVIADDLTGAAEIGGIAYLAGFSVRIVLEFGNSDKYHEDVIIIDSNSRHLSEERAFHKIAFILQILNLANYDLIFKKTDSLLRGNIEPEILAFFFRAFFHSALLIPANPSKKQSINCGKYYIENIPINETIYRSDPEYPRKWKMVKNLFRTQRTITISGNKMPKNWNGRIFIPDINSVRDIETNLEKIENENVLFAGGAEFFKSVIKNKFGCTFKNNDSSLNRKAGQKCFIMGSNSNNCKKTLSILSEKKFKIFHLPGSSIRIEKHFQNWVNNILSKLREGYNIVVATPHEFIRKKTDRIRITKRVVQTACLINNELKTRDLIFIEGGETASSFFRELNWQELTVKSNFDDGVVMLQPENLNMGVVIKPGSYLWPRLVIEQL